VYPVLCDFVTVKKKSREINAVKNRKKNRVINVVKNWKKNREINSRENIVKNLVKLQLDVKIKANKKILVASI